MITVSIKGTPEEIGKLMYWIKLDAKGIPEGVHTIFLALYNDSSYRYTIAERGNDNQWLTVCNKLFDNNDLSRNYSHYAIAVPPE
jgi:hypothetical protein